MFAGRWVIKSDAQRGWAWQLSSAVVQRLLSVGGECLAHGLGSTAVIDMPGRGRGERPVCEVLLT
jgi:hypothetical protein